MLVHTDPRLEKAIVLSFPRDLWVNIPGRGDGQDQRGVLGRPGRRRRANGRARRSSSSTGLKINHVLYVDLAGFQGIVDTLRGVTMCIPEPRILDRSRAGSADRAGRQCRLSDAQRLPSACLRAHASPAVRLRSGLLADRPAAAVPPRRIEPAAVARRDREAPAIDRPGRAQPRGRPRLRARRHHLSW